MSIWEKVIKLVASPKEEEGEEGKVLWRCYDCGVTSDEGGFETIKTWTDYGYEYDCECLSCGSTLTFEDGNGSPSCETCNNYEWYCDKCRITKCSECWKWFPTPNGEPEEYLCTECDQPEEAAKCS